MIDSKMLEILACPSCKEDLEFDEESSELICQGCGLIYPVIDGIPVMIIDEDRKQDCE